MFKEQGADEAEKLKDFKTGLGDSESATKRHTDKANVLRRKKHDEKIQRLRNQNSSSPSNLSSSSLFQNNGKEGIEECKRVFLSTGSYEALIYLKNYTHVSTDPELNTILDTPLVVSLASLLTHQQEQYASAAADCLVNITGCVDDERIGVIGHLIIKTPFLQVVMQHLAQPKTTSIFLDVWKIVANIACLCEDARTVLLKSAIFISQNETLPLFASEFEKRDPATLSILVLILHAYSSVENSHEAFVYSQWNRLTNLLYTLFPEPMRPVDYEENALLEMVILTIENTIESSFKDKSAFAIRLLLLDKKLITFMVRMMERIHPMGQNKWRIARFLVRVGQLQLPQFEFQHMMREAGAIQIMCKLCDQLNEPLRIEAMRWIGNYASECATFVQHLLTLHAYDFVISVIQRYPKEAVIDQAIYIMDASVRACLKEQPQADSILQSLLVEKQFLSLTVQRVGKMACEARTLDILGMWYRLLKWNKRFVLPILEEHGGMDRVDMLLGDKNPAIYKAAAQIDDFVQSYGGEPQDMDERE